MKTQPDVGIEFTFGSYQVPGRFGRRGQGQADIETVHIISQVVSWLGQVSHYPEAPKLPNNQASLSERIADFEDSKSRKLVIVGDEAERLGIAIDLMSTGELIGAPSSHINADKLHVVRRIFSDYAEAG